MLLAIGTKVQIRHTGEHGIIREFLDDEMVEVYLSSDDMTIPVSVEDLLDPNIPKPAQQKTTRPQNRIPLPKQQYFSLKSEGVLLGFEPTEDEQAFNVFLLNDSNAELLFSFRKLQRGSIVKSNHGKVKVIEAEELDLFLKIHLSDQTIYELDCWPILPNGGSGKKRTKQIRLKPKAFFNNKRTVPILNRQMHCYSVIESFTESNKTEKSEDLKSYTANKLRDKKTERYDNSDLYTVHDVLEFADFVPEIDLHIESLHADSGALKSNEILRYQLAAFDEFLEKAIRLGIDRVFVIHGIGKGKLRDALFTRLMKHEDVNTFKNEFHPKYGWGATEIIF